jgi:hypothetical protein
MIQFHDAWPMAKWLAMQFLIEKASDEKQIIGREAELQQQQQCISRIQQRFAAPGSWPFPS